MEVWGAGRNFTCLSDGNQMFAFPVGRVTSTTQAEQPACRATRALVVKHAAHANILCSTGA